MATPDTNARRLSKPAPVFGLILAGGRSRRMGQDKSTLRYNNVPLIHHLYAILSACCAGVFVSVRRDQADSLRHLGFPQIFDAYPFGGPLNGILSAMQTIPTAPWLVIACDLPHLDRNALQRLLEYRRPEWDATLFMDADGLPNPVCGIYEPSIRSKLLTHARHENISARRALISMGSRVHLVRPPDPDTLFDANTPEDRIRAELAFQAKSAHRH